ncbi:bifunctional 2-polyprenyl-6-hydroxyphenol methylase/3-demethylubiquinol 3-O-methyltransferase UbiG [Acaryochloris sp. CCMEE 5410]|uniref:class I SAM-dependent methyltransferase n=1 Tax=Acaryochloris sp. CCMEE 5410 TaxID=310037 RepID=UPI000303F98C|nr:class I SAM-dependent methyltransferase [Acaryochloris sp. CCMEE 5410]KAI9134146.1 class I SAM-dependent methyltransferase [Acaryochloris sp. CCMEE 5410]
MSRHRAQQLASEFLARSDAKGWFEALYAEAGDVYSAVPWADLAPNPNLVEWSISQELKGAGKTALVIGCGYGDDAEFLAELGFEVVAFDVSPTAIAQCNQRFPNSPVSYQVADLLNPSATWSPGFDFVLEAYTLQVLPPALRAAAISNISRLIAPLGQLLVIARGREETDPPGRMPYPLTRKELASFEALGLSNQSFEDYLDNESPPVRRFRALYTAVSTA